MLALVFGKNVEVLLICGKVLAENLLYQTV